MIILRPSELTDAERKELDSIEEKDLDALIDDYTREAKYIRKDNFGGGQAAAKCEKTAMILLGYKELARERNERNACQSGEESLWRRKYEEERNKRIKLCSDMELVRRSIDDIVTRQEREHRELCEHIKELEQCLTRR